MGEKVPSKQFHLATCKNSLKKDSSHKNVIFNPIFLYTDAWNVLLQGTFLSNSQAREIGEEVLKVIDEKKPQSVKQLVTILKESFCLEEKDIVQSILKLETEGSIKLENQAPQSHSLATHLKTREAAWYWITITAAAVSAALFLEISENDYPWVYARNILGIVFVLFLPGYALIKALFPVKMLARKTVENLGTTEQATLSVAMSIAAVSIVGLLLNFSPWGLNLNAIILSLLAFTSILATVAIIRKLQAARIIRTP